MIILRKSVSKGRLSSTRKSWPGSGWTNWETFIEDSKEGDDTSTTQRNSGAASNFKAVFSAELLSHSSELWSPAWLFCWSASTKTWQVMWDSWPKDRWWNQTRLETHSPRKKNLTEPQLRVVKARGSFSYSTYIDFSKYYFRNEYIMLYYNLVHGEVLPLHKPCIFI